MVSPGSASPPGSETAHSSARHEDFYRAHRRGLAFRREVVQVPFWLFAHRSELRPSERACPGSYRPAHSLSGCSQVAPACYVRATDQAVLDDGITGRSAFLPHLLLFKGLPLRDRCLDKRTAFSVALLWRARANRSTARGQALLENLLDDVHIT